MLSQDTSGAAVHWHSRAVVTAICPVPPWAGNVASVAPSVTAQREMVLGEVAVEVEDPHAASSGATATSARNVRRVTANGTPRASPRTRTAVLAVIAAGGGSKNWPADRL